MVWFYKTRTWQELWKTNIIAKKEDVDILQDHFTNNYRLNWWMKYTYWWYYLNKEWIINESRNNSRTTASLHFMLIGFMKPKQVTWWIGTNQLNCAFVFVINKWLNERWRTKQMYYINLYTNLWYLPKHSCN